MIGHVWRHDGKLLLQQKVRLKVLTICKLSDEQRKQIENKINEMSREG